MSFGIAEPSNGINNLSFRFLNAPLKTSMTGWKNNRE